MLLFPPIDNDWLSGLSLCFPLPCCLGFAGTGETTAPLLSTSTLPGKGPGPGGGELALPVDMELLNIRVVF
jgi:hypothetical protein